MMEQTNKLWSTAKLFDANLRSLRMFCKEVGRLADRQDETIKDRPLQLVETELGIPAEEIRSEAASLEANLDIDSSQPWDINNPTAEQQQAMQTLSDNLATLAQEDPQAAERAFLILDAMTSVLPIQGELLRRGAMFNLWSYFENLLTELIQVHYLMYPQALPESTITLAQLREIGSIKEVETYLAAEEAERVQHKSLDDQLEYFENRLNVDLGPLKPYRDRLSEIAQRRNLLVHNQGVVNHIYLSKAPRRYVGQQGIQLGQTLNVTEDYLIQVLDTVCLAGTIILQQCWRQWERDPKRILFADFILAHKGIYQALLDAHYELACRLSEYASSIKLANEANAREVTINHAIAMKELGDHQAMEQLIASVDWTACALKYQIALLSLRGENEKLFDLLPQAVALGDVKPADLDKWPLFNSLRNDPRFISLLEAVKNGDGKVHQ